MASSRPTGKVGDRFTEMSEEDVSECEEIFKKQGLAGCLEYLKSKGEEWKKIPLNVAVIGLSGCGKSTFINSIRGLRSKDVGAAAVGVNETTKEIKAYPHPSNKMLVFWDLPGVGTENFPKESYLEKIEFDKYDCYIIMTANRFFEIDAWLGDEIGRTKKSFYYVRSKIGIDVRNDKYENGKDHDVNKLIQDIKDRTMTEVHKKLKFKVPLFLIDSQERTKYDFDEVERRVVEDLPKLKRNAMAYSLSAFSKPMIKSKVDELRRRAWYMTILSGSTGIATVLIPGVSVAVNIGIWLGEATFYFKQLGLDEASLQQRANFFSVDTEHFKEIFIKHHLPAEINFDYIKSIVRKGVNKDASVSTEFWHFYFFITYSIVPLTSFVIVYKTLKDILDKMEAVALAIANFTEQLLLTSDDGCINAAG